MTCTLQSPCPGLDFFRRTISFPVQLRFTTLSTSTKPNQLSELNQELAFTSRDVFNINSSLYQLLHESIIFGMKALAGGRRHILLLRQLPVSRESSDGQLT
ncbi:unnamed protein product [Protopolystoma xenopodis]|uniref:Uncharacterized protein n=1 Tax=Protopolystoma xenopodis TaxID=117903 RepID=A0A448WQA7_9PLAT|nr:unnamed protein product [Protopolystoma xenopodis]